MGRGHRQRKPRQVTEAVIGDSRTVSSVAFYNGAGSSAMASAGAIADVSSRLRSRARELRKQLAGGKMGLAAAVSIIGARGAGELQVLDSILGNTPTITDAPVLLETSTSASGDGAVALYAASELLFRAT